MACVWSSAAKSSEGVTSANFTQKVTLSQSGAETWLSVGSSQMLLSNVDADDLYLENFILAQISGNDVEETENVETPTIIDIDVPVPVEGTDTAALNALMRLQGAETEHERGFKIYQPVNDAIIG